VVCLLGMNDGDFPRRTQHADFDLLALPGMARPGDRSRRDDDRYLMLEALLAARDKLYISWVGRNVRDNSEQPPSVLVSQLRDYLAAGWKLDLAPLTTEHALQPFSRKYFEEGGLLTYAGEWRAAHAGVRAAGEAVLGPFECGPDSSLKLSDLAGFMRQPVKYFFRHRLSVSFLDAAGQGEDEEPFSFDGLKRFQLEDALLCDVGEPEALSEVRACMIARAERLVREGVLPLGLIGKEWQRERVDALVPVRSAWLTLRERFPRAGAKLALGLQFGELRVDDWLDQLRSNGGESVCLMRTSSKVLDKKGQARGDKLILMWLRQLATAALGHPVKGFLAARDAVIGMPALDTQQAYAALGVLVALWREGMNRPMPTACRTALALVGGGDPRAIYDGGFDLPGERDDLCLARLWPDFAALAREKAWIDCSRELYGPLADWLKTIHITPIGEQGEAQ
jgi:exodeoxyribonuclease V gamma subunit